MKWLKDLLYNKNLNTRLNELQRVKNEGRNQSAYIGILVDEHAIDNSAALDKVIKEWEKKGKKVVKTSFIAVKELEEGSTRAFCLKDISWFGIPKGDVVDTFLAEAYDILITINPEFNKSMHYLNAVSRAKFKIGLSADDVKFNNMIVDCEKPSHVQTAFRDIQITLDKLAIS